MPKPRFVDDDIWIQTASGRKLSFVKPNSAPKNLWLPDIAFALYNCNRFAGHLHFPWSVGKHSMAMGIYYQLSGKDDMIILDGLLHDAHEAYTGDLPSPLKYAVPEVMAVQDKLQSEILAAFGITESRHKSEAWQSDSDQAHLDMAFCRAEAEMFFPSIHENWIADLPEPDALVFKSMVMADKTEHQHFVAAVRHHMRAADIDPETCARVG